MDQRIITSLLIILVCMVSVKYFKYIETFDTLDKHWSDSKCDSAKCQHKINYLAKKNLSYDIKSIGECNGCPILHYNNPQVPSGGPQPQGPQGPQQQHHPQGPLPLPGGSWISSAQNYSMSGNMLIAQLRNEQGNWTPASTFVTPNTTYSNNNGQFVQDPMSRPFFTLPATNLNGSLNQILGQSSLQFTYVSQGLFTSADNAYCAFVVNFSPPPSNPPPQNQYLFFTTLTNGIPDLPSSGKGSSNSGGWYGIGQLNLSCLKINNPMSVYPQYPISSTDYNKLSPPAYFGNQQWTTIVNP